MASPCLTTVTCCSLCAAARATNAYMAYMKRHDINPFKAMMVPLAQVSHSACDVDTNTRQDKYMYNTAHASPTLHAADVILSLCGKKTRSYEVCSSCC